ncbi:hypothetical protein [Risungbinella massiliensis]|uniref:hypothetical protein n=1 Tax=Risungbinella massiliensis TaxID=1329796 RepID=UPI0005CC252F|nr:hypothetical protein [Risungbinella massiliensis]
MKKKFVLLAPFIVIAICAVLFVYRNIFVIEPAFAELQEDAKEFIPSGVRMLAQDPEQNLSMWDLDGDQKKEGIAVYEYPATKQKEILVMKKKVIGYEVTKTPVNVQDEVKEVKVQDLSGDKIPEITLIRESRQEGMQPPYFRDKVSQNAFILTMNPKSPTLGFQQIAYVKGTTIFQTDLDHNQIEELVVLEMTSYPEYEDGDYQPGKAKAKLLQLKDNQLTTIQEIDLGELNAIYSHLGKIDSSGRKGIVVAKPYGNDQEVDDRGAYNVLVMQDGKLMDLLETTSFRIDNISFKDMLDINKDDILDIPVFTYEGTGPKFEFTTPIVHWYNFTADNQRIKVAESVTGLGFDWVIPSSWENLALKQHRDATSTYFGSCLTINPEKIEMMCLYITKKQDISYFSEYEYHVLDTYQDYIVIGYMNQLDASIANNYPQTNKVLKEQLNLKNQMLLWGESERKIAMKTFEEILKHSAIMNPHGEGLYEDDL